MNSTTKIIAGVAVLALLFAGIGFALNYEGKVTNTDNSVEPKYIVAVAGIEDTTMSMADVLDAVPFDTETVADDTEESGYKVTYKIQKNYPEAEPTETQISKEGWAVTVTKTDNFGADTKYSLKVVAEEFTAVEGVTYKMYVGETDATGAVVDGKFCWTFSNLDFATSYDIVLTVTVGDTVELTEENLDFGFTGIDFVFTATAIE